ncbi:MAG: hypothetical protein WB995_10230 [Candidatus Acidiferrales bacterium]
MTRKTLLPAQLKGKFPPEAQDMVDARIFWDVFGIGLCLFFVIAASLRAPVETRLIDWLSYVGIVLGPLTASLVIILLPIQPYRDSWRARAADMQNLDKRDPTARRLVEILASTSARHFSLVMGLRLSLTLLVVTVAMRTAFRLLGLHAHEMRPRDLFIMGYIFCSLMSFIMFKFEMMAWAFKNWTNVENINQRPPT